jgi:hypothetical protein
MFYNLVRDIICALIKIEGYTYTEIKLYKNGGHIYLDIGEEFDIDLFIKTIELCKFQKLTISDGQMGDTVNIYKPYLKTYSIKEDEKYFWLEYNDKFDTYHSRISKDKDSILQAEKIENMINRSKKKQ